MDTFNPIPIAAALIFFGRVFNSLLTDPIVNLSSGNGKIIRSGEKIRDEIKLIFGIAV